MKKVTKRRVLILNKSYEALNTMSVETALKKLSKPDARMEVEVWDDENVVHTSKGAYPIPVVIRLTYYLDLIKKREKSGSKRFSIYKRDKFKCAYCGEKITDLSKLTLDHIYPKSRGGRNTPDNLVTCCYVCNHRKGDRTPEEARMKLLVPKSLLKVRLDTVQMSNYLEYYPIWRKYLFLEGPGHPNLTAEGDKFLD